MLPSGLSAEQAEKINALQQAVARQNIDFEQQIRAAQDRLAALEMSENRDWPAIRTAAQRWFELQGAHSMRTLDLQQQIEGVLTERQRQEKTRAWRSYGGTVAQ